MRIRGHVDGSYEPQPGGVETRYELKVNASNPRTTIAKVVDGVLSENEVRRLT